MARGLPESHPLHRLFRGLTESTFLDELGIGDPRLVGYVAGLLARFVPADEVFRLRDAGGTRLRCVTAMVAEAESTADDDRRRECHRHVGDFTLFWTGVYPESVPRLHAPDGPDTLLDFQAQGKRSYYLASRPRSEESDILLRLSDQFDLCAFGLSRVRREWEKWGAERPGGEARLIVA